MDDRIVKSCLEWRPVVKNHVAERLAIDGDSRQRSNAWRNVRMTVPFNRLAHRGLVLAMNRTYQQFRPGLDLVFGRRIEVGIAVRHPHRHLIHDLRTTMDGWLGR